MARLEAACADRHLTVATFVREAALDAIRD
jgi:hypothetical protein